MTGSLHSRQEALVAELQRLRDPQSRFAWVVERSRQCPLLPDPLRLDIHRVEGCQVRIWFVPEFRDQRCWFRSDSDAITLRAMTGLLCELANGCPPSELLDWTPEFLDRLGLLRQLAENRRATVLRVAEKIRAFARERL